MGDYTPDPRLVEASGDPEAFQAVYSALIARYENSIRIGHMTEFADEVTAFVVQVLHRDGRLQPVGDDPDLWQYGRPDPDEGVGAVVTFIGRPRIVTPRMLRRPMRATGPWQPVPTEGAPDAH